MNRIQKGLASIAAAFVALAPHVAHAQLEVVATVPDLAAIAKELGGEHVQVTSLALSTQDPHFVDARPHLALVLHRADLLLTVGLGLEAGWLPTLLVGARNPDIQAGAPGHLDCSTLVRLLEVPAQRVDRSMGDVHPGGNPHYLYDPRAAAIVAQGIAERLRHVDVAHAAVYVENLARFLDRLKHARETWESRLRAHRGAPLVAFHKTTAYLADWLGLAEVDYLEPKPGIPPNPAHVARVLGVARQRGVRLVTQEQYYPDVTAKLVAEKIPAALARLPGGTRFEKGQSYVEHLNEIGAMLHDALGKAPR